jgi:hypothetical protein
MKRMKGAMVALVAFASSVAGASCVSDRWLEEQCPATQCADANCDQDVACPGGAGCPQGTRCMADLCVASPPPAIEPEALIDGFKAREFDLVRATGDDARYELTAPDGADRVACGLFTCAPVIVERSAGSQTLRRIANTSQCLQREHVFTTQPSGELQTFKFGLADLRSPEPNSCRASMLGLGDPSSVSRTGYPLVEALRIGCWASDRTHVIAATRLVAVGVTDLPEGARLMRRDCQEVADGTWCILPGDLGVCVAADCDFTMVPSPVDSLSGAGGQGSPTSVAPEVETVTDCRGVADGVACRRKEVESVGQCLSSRCLKQSTDEYTQPLAVSDCGAEGAVTDWLNCYPSPTLSFGTCCGARCRLRCREDQDCASALDDAGVTCKANDTTCEPRPERCHREPGSYLGVCALPEESEPCKSE